MNILLHKKYLGTSQHALLKDSMLKWVSCDDQDCLVYGGDNGHYRSLEPLVKIMEDEVPALVPSEYTRMMQICGEANPQWRYVIPSDTYNKNLKNVIRSLTEIQERLPSFEYFKTYVDSQDVFRRLVPASINRKVCEEILKKEDNSIVKNILDSSKDARALIPQYDRSSTKTGRLVVKGGPQVLTLKKEYRNIFIPSSKGSKIYEVDFSSLEPRVAANISRDHVGADVYSSFIEHYGIRITREAAKLAVLCAMYGAGNATLKSQLKKQGLDTSPDYLIKKVKEYFGVSDLVKKLRAQLSTSGMIFNYFGRPINVDDNRDSLLLNNYLQSTAVDVALLGFSKFCQELGDKVLPLFIIHDALFFEAKDIDFAEICEYLSNGFSIESFGNFPLKITEFEV